MTLFTFNVMIEIKRNGENINMKKKISEEAGGMNVVVFMVTFFQPVLFF